MESQYYKLGMAVAAATRGESADDVLLKKAHVDKLSDHKEYGYGAVQRLVCKYAAEAYKECGKMDQFSYHMFNKMASTRNWWPELELYSDVALAALGKVHGEIRKEAADAEIDAVFEKQALNLFTNLAAGVGRISPGVLKLMLATGALSGMTGGAAAWMANRGVHQDIPKIEAMKSKINYYNQLTDEIESELQRRGAPTDREDVEDVVQNII